MTKITTTTLTLILASLLAFASTACNGTRPTIAQATSETAATRPGKAKKEHYTCGARNKDGTACRKPVKNQGDRCFIHAGRPARDDEPQATPSPSPATTTAKANNPCRLPKGSQPKEDCYYEDGDVTRPIPGTP
jgi:hypothetical protein